MALEVIDSHFHIWDLDKLNLEWLKTTDGSISKTYTFQDFESQYAQLNDINFLGGVYVEVDCVNTFDEDVVIFETMKANPKILAAMLRSNVEPSMRLPVFASGVREPLHIEENPKGRCLQDSFIEGLEQLAISNLPFESCNRVDELEDAYKAFSKVPKARIILNHLGNVDELSNEYKNAMQKLASLPNLYLKVSGFATHDKQFVKELLDFISNTFDEEKLLYASNWPVVELYSDFAEHFNTVREYFGDNTKLFKENAVRAYNLKIEN